MTNFIPFDLFVANNVRGSGTKDDPYTFKVGSLLGDVFTLITLKARENEQDGPIYYVWARKTWSIQII